MILFILSIVLIVVGVLLVIGEIESEEVDFFGPVALFCMIMGILMWFFSNPIVIMRSWELFVVVSAIFLSIVIIFSGFSIFVTIKMIKIRNAPTTDQEFIGGLGKVVKLITKTKDGYIKYKGELWKAGSDHEISPKQKVKVIKKDGIRVQVEPLILSSLMYCPNCGDKIREEAIVCSKCGEDLSKIE
ncbi:MAG: zinc-ribbon domain-containing protein [Candidatus Lokiarchaeota archaeon]|nr:zinc-ribbon domain-containing protein [Candidatus Lokiarchaeota archaeon]